MFVRKFYSIFFENSVIVNSKSVSALVMGDCFEVRSDMLNGCVENGLIDGWSAVAGVY